MKTDHATLFELVEPPANGVRDLRARLSLNEHRLSWGWGFAAAGAVMGLLVFVLAQPRKGDVEPALLAKMFDVREFDRLLGKETQPYELRVKLNTREAVVVEVSSSDPKIRLYQIN